MFFLDILQDILKQHLIFLIFPFLSEKVNLPIDIIEDVFTNLAVQTHSIDADNEILLLCFILELFDNWRIGFNFFKGKFILFELLVEICMLSSKGRIILRSFMLFILSLSLLKSTFGLCQLLAILFLHLFLRLYISFVVSYSLIESLSR
jgi:hypothetical protein